MDTTKFTKEETSQSQTGNEIKRVYHAPRLDAAFDMQENAIRWA